MEKINIQKCLEKIENQEKNLYLKISLTKMHLKSVC